MPMYLSLIHTHRKRERERPSYSEGKRRST